MPNPLAGVLKGLLAKAAAKSLPTLERRLADALEDRLSDAEVTTLIERARRQVGDRPVADALQLESEMRANPRRQLRSGTWDAAEAALAQGRGSRMRETAEAQAARATKRAERSTQNRARYAAHREAKKGKSPEEQHALDVAFDAETERLTGVSGRSIRGSANVEGGTRDSGAKAARSAANKEVNRALQAGEITQAEAATRYAQIKAGASRGNSQRAVSAAESSNRKVGDARDADENAYFDTNNPEAADRVIGFRHGREITQPGGLDQALVTAASVTRRHIERMIASGEIPNAPPDAAMPGILRTAMNELGIGDKGFDDFALMRAYRQQARRGSAFSTRRPQQSSAPAIGSDDVDEVGRMSMEKMRTDLAGGVNRQEVEEGFADVAARELAEGDEVGDAGLTGRELARRTAQAAYADVPADASFRERESIRRGRGRATRQMRAYDRLDEGASEYAEKSNISRARRRAEDEDPTPRRPRMVNRPDPTLGPGGVYVKARGGRTKDVLDEEGNIVKPGRFFQRNARVEGSGTEVARDPSAEGPAHVWPKTFQTRPSFQGPQQAKMEVQPFQSPFSGLEPGGVERSARTSDVGDHISEESLADNVERLMADGDVDGMMALMNRMRGLRELVETATIDQSAANAAVRDASARDDVTDEADRLVRNIMRRVADMPPQARDEYFAAGPLDQQMMLNRQRSSSLRDLLRDVEARSGDDVDFGRDDIGFPSKMGRRTPREGGNPELLRQILAAMGGMQE